MNRTALKATLMAAMVGASAREQAATLQTFTDVSAMTTPRGCDEIAQMLGMDEDTVRLLQAQTGLPVIRAFRVKDPSDIRATAADYRLFDTYDPSQYGGSGAAFNWDLLQGVTGDFFLAGGLNSGNIAAAIQQVRPYCVDFSSGVETDGVKDRDKIIEIVEMIRTINR